MRCAYSQVDCKECVKSSHHRGLCEIEKLHSKLKPKELAALEKRR